MTITSVHLANFPDINTLPEDKQLVADMDKVRDACNAALSVRNAENIRIRQPLATLTIVGEGASRLEPFFPLIKDELNVKEVSLSEDVKSVASHNLKINFPVLGKRLPEKMKQIIPASKKGEWKQLPNGRIEILGEELTPEECSLTLEPKAKNGAQPLSTNDALVILDLNITEELRLEGIARDLVRLIQQSRKDADLNVSDRIELIIETDNADIRKAVEDFSRGNDFSIADNTLATEFTLGSTKNCQHSFEQTLEKATVTIGFSVAEGKRAVG